MENDISIMDITNGNVIDVYFDTQQEALDWIEEQDVPEMYKIMEIEKN